MCDCGNISTVTSYLLTSGHTRSCGCLKKVKLIQRCTTHGESKSKEYKIWRYMINRCERQADKHYKDYGGRGIKVCSEWRNNFSVFLSDMGKCENGLTLDRIDSNGDYKKENCRWATATEQANNKRTNIIIHFNGKSNTLTQWAKEMNIPRPIIAYRYYRGARGDALFAPVSQL